MVMTFNESLGYYFNFSYKYKKFNYKTIKFAIRKQPVNSPFKYNKTYIQNICEKAYQLSKKWTLISNSRFGFGSGCEVEFQIDKLTHRVICIIRVTDIKEMDDGSIPNDIIEEMKTDINKIFKHVYSISGSGHGGSNRWEGIDELSIDSNSLCTYLIIDIR